MSYFVRNSNGSTPEFVSFGGKLIVDATQDGGVAPNGTVAVEEYVPGKGWVSRHSFNAVGRQELQTPETPTRWRATVASISAGAWGMAFR